MWINIWLWAQSVKISMLYINIYQNIFIMEVPLNNQLNKMALPVLLTSLHMLVTIKQWAQGRLTTLRETMLHTDLAAQTYLTKAD